MKKVIVYSTPTCIYCQMLKDWLKQNSVPFTAYDLSRDVERREEVIKKTGQMAVPVIEIDDEIIIGFDKKKLSELLGLN